MGVYEVYTIARVYVSMHVGKNPDNILSLPTKNGCQIQDGGHSESNVTMSPSILLFLRIHLGIIFVHKEQTVIHR